MGVGERQQALLDDSAAIELRLLELSDRLDEHTAALRAEIARRRESRGDDVRPG